jgi:PHD/YefM family antitoxin component YafN of YafNO toxin-antitoxin module
LTSTLVPAHPGTLFLTYTCTYPNISIMNPIALSYSVRDLQRNYRAVLNDAKRTHDAVLLINNSVPEAVVLDVETYNALVGDNYVWDEKQTLKLVKEAVKSCKTGKAKRLKSWDDLDA